MSKTAVFLHKVNELITTMTRSFYIN